MTQMCALANLERGLAGNLGALKQRVWHALRVVQRSLTSSDLSLTPESMTVKRETEGDTEGETEGQTRGVLPLRERQRLRKCY